MRPPAAAQAADPLVRVPHARSAPGRGPRGDGRAPDRPSAASQRQPADAARAATNICAAMKAGASPGAIPASRAPLPLPRVAALERPAAVGGGDERMADVGRLLHPDDRDSLLAAIPPAAKRCG